MQGFATWLADTSFSMTIKDVTWIIPLVQSIHIVTIGIVFISSLMIALRVLGRMRVDEPFSAVWGRFAPWMWSGLVVMVITGLLLIMAEPVREFTALSFWLKMSLLVIGVIGTAAFGHTFAPAARSASAAEFSLGAKTAATGMVVLWLAVIFLGRAIAYDVEVWGSLSLHG